MPKRINHNPPTSNTYNISVRLDYNDNITAFKVFHDVTNTSMNATINKIVNEWVEQHRAEMLEALQAKEEEFLRELEESKNRIALAKQLFNNN